MRLIDANALKDIEYINKGNFNTVEGIREWIDNAPTVEIPNYGGQVVPDTLQGWRYEERSQGDLISRSELKKAFDDYIKANPNISGIFEVGKFITDNAPTVIPDIEEFDKALHKWFEDIDEWEKKNGKIRPQGDLISRSEVEKLGATCLAKRNKNGQLEAIISLDNAPTVAINPDYVTELQEHNKELIKQLEEVERTKGKWIPVSERLPSHDEYIKNNGLFNVSDGNRSYSEWFDIYDKQGFGEPTMAGFRVDYAVTAWQPLPEPYKEGC